MKAFAQDIEAVKEVRKIAAGLRACLGHYRRDKGAEARLLDAICQHQGHIPQALWDETARMIEQQP